MAATEQIEAFLAEPRNVLPGDEELLRSLIADDRVLLVLTPDQPLEKWTHWGLD